MKNLKMEKINKCPQCESNLVERFSSKNGFKFIGCSGYPRCQFSANPQKGRYKASKKESPFKPNTELVEWIWNYFKSRKSSSKPFIPPLYLQHDGHSRTVVGIEKRGNLFQLLIFDPSHYGPTLLKDLHSKKLNKIKKSQLTFTKEKYQIVYIDEELLQDVSLNQFKVIDSVAIHSN